MDRTFDPDQFIARIGKRLVEQFNDARNLAGKWFESPNIYNWGQQE